MTEEKVALKWNNVSRPNPTSIIVSASALNYSHCVGGARGGRSCNKEFNLPGDLEWEPGCVWGGEGL